MSYNCRRLRVVNAIQDINGGGDSHVNGIHGLIMFSGSRYWWESLALSTPSYRTVAVAGDPSARNACSFFIYQINSEVKDRAFYSANGD